MEAPSPIEAIKFRMEQMNLKQTDIAPILWWENKSFGSAEWKKDIDIKNDYAFKPVFRDTSGIVNSWKY